MSPIAPRHPLIFTLETQPDGFLRVRKIQEVLKLRPQGRMGAVSGPQSTSWGEVKALYK